MSDIPRALKEFFFDFINWISKYLPIEELKLASQNLWRELSSATLFFSIMWVFTFLNGIISGLSDFKWYGVFIFLGLFCFYAARKQFNKNRDIINKNK
jgi:hypothetical protein